MQMPNYAAWRTSRASRRRPEAMSGNNTNPIPPPHPSALARLQLLRRVFLSPERANFSELSRLTLVLLRRGLRVFNLKFHSLFRNPGNTRFSRTRSALDQRSDRWDHFFDSFRADIVGTSITPKGLKQIAHTVQ